MVADGFAYTDFEYQYQWVLKCTSPQCYILQLPPTLPLIQVAAILLLLAIQILSVWGPAPEAEDLFATPARCEGSLLTFSESPVHVS